MSGGRDKILLFGLLLIVSVLVTVAIPGIQLLESQALDFKSYYIAGHLALEKQNIYNPHDQLNVAMQQGLGTHFYPYIYFPVLAVIMMPLAMVPFTTAQWFWITVSILVFYGCLALLAFLLKEVTSEALKLLDAVNLVLACSILEGVYANTIYGQVNSFILFFLVLMLFAMVRNMDIAAGFFLGLVIMIKPQPAIIVPYLFMIKRYRTCFSAVLTTAVGTMATAMVIGTNNFMYYINEVMPTFSMIKTNFPPIIINAPPNRSIQGTITRLFIDSQWITAPFNSSVHLPTLVRITVLTMLAVSFTILVVSIRKVKPDNFTIWTHIGYLMLLSVIVSPLTWSHHFTVLPFFMIPYLYSVFKADGRLTLFKLSVLWVLIAIPTFPMSPIILNLGITGIFLLMGQSVSLCLLWLMAGNWLITSKSR